MKEAEVALPGPSYCCALALTLGGGTPKAHEEPSPLVGAQGTTRKGKEKHRIHLTSSLRQNNVILYVFSFTGGNLTISTSCLLSPPPSSQSGVMSLRSNEQRQLGGARAVGAFQ